MAEDSKLKWERNRVLKENVSDEKEKKMCSEKNKLIDTIII